jgi:hypothetical protein
MAVVVPRQQAGASASPATAYSQGHTHTPYPPIEAAAEENLSPSGRGHNAPAPELQRCGDVVAGLKAPRTHHTLCCHQPCVQPGGVREETQPASGPEHGGQVCWGCARAGHQQQPLRRAHKRCHCRWRWAVAPHAQRPECVHDLQAREATGANAAPPATGPGAAWRCCNSDGGRGGLVLLSAAHSRSHKCVHPGSRRCDPQLAQAPGKLAEAFAFHDWQGGRRCMPQGSQP